MKKSDKKGFLFYSIVVTICGIVKYGCMYGIYVFNLSIVEERSAGKNPVLVR